MKIKALIILVFLSLTACSGMEKAQEKINQSTNTGGITNIQVEDFNGDIEVSVGGDQKVTIDALKTGSGRTRREAQDDLKEIAVDVSRDNQTLRIKSYRKDNTPADGSSVQLKIGIPEGLNLQITTGKGSLTILLPAQSAFALQATTGHGKISSDFPVASSDAALENVLNGTVGPEPKITIQASTGRGDITISQQK